MFVVLQVIQMSRFVDLSNYTEILLLNVDKGHSFGESNYDWYVELDKPSNFYPNLYPYLLNDDPLSVVGIVIVVDVVTKNLLRM